MSQNTKAKILKTAETMLRTQGYDGASLNDIVAKAGVSKGAFFHYYPNKQAIALELIDQYAQEQIFAPLAKHLENAANVKAGLLAWLEESYRAYAQWGFKGGCMLGNFALEMADKDEKIREHLKFLFLSWENLLVNALRNASMDIEPRQFARMIIAMYEGVTMTAKVHKDVNRAGRDFQALAAFIGQSIRD